MTIDSPARSWQELRMLTWDESDRLAEQFDDFKRLQEARVRDFVDHYVRPHLLYFCSKYRVSFTNMLFKSCLPESEEMFAIMFPTLPTVARPDSTARVIQFYRQSWMRFQSHPAYSRHMEQLPDLLEDYQQLYAILSIPIKLYDGRMQPVQCYVADVIPN